MNELKIKIKHCYGIKKLEEKNVLVINHNTQYIANGTMKSFLYAKTFIH